MGDLKEANVAPTRGRGRFCDRSKGRGPIRGAAPPRGKTRLISLEPTYELVGPTNPIPPPLTPVTTPSIQELLLMKHLTPQLLLMYQFL